MTGLAGGAGWLKREPPLLPDPKLPPDLATGAWNPDAAAACKKDCFAPSFANVLSFADGSVKPA